MPLQINIKEDEILLLVLVSFLLCLSRIQFCYHFSNFLLLTFSSPLPNPAQDFLKQRKMYEAMRAVEVEGKVSLDKYGQELMFLRSMVMDGQWDDVESFLQPLRSIAHSQPQAGFDYERVLFEVRKQNFLELLHNEVGGSVSL